MRRDDQPIKQDSEAVGFNFHFQIGSGSGRKACSVRVQAHNFHDATDFFRQNWPTIELMARESLASAANGREIELAMPYPVASEHRYVDQPIRYDDELQRHAPS
jgi:hypothetical protein